MKAFKNILICLNIMTMSAGIYIALTDVPNDRIKTLLLFIVISFGVVNCGNYIYFRKRFVRFSNNVCRSMEKIFHGHSVRQMYNKETLTSKMIMEIEKVEDVFAFHVSESKKEKKELQEMISEITHQIKTPVSNIQMYSEMFSDPALALSDADHYIEVIRRQLERLDFLLDILVKSSRLETEMINLQMENCKVADTLAIGVNQVILKAEDKKIDISVECRPTLEVCHDQKWTAEAIENILDNAIKYTPEGGKVMISADAGEMYTQIKIKDTGKGIEAAHINDIFKRFYREKSVSKIEGLGLGLYLARTILTLQGGYISVQSAIGAGSCFILCLPNRIPR